MMTEQMKEQVIIIEREHGKEEIAGYQAECGCVHAPLLRQRIVAACTKDHNQ